MDIEKFNSLNSVNVYEEEEEESITPDEGGTEDLEGGQEGLPGDELGTDPSGATSDEDPETDPATDPNAEAPQTINIGGKDYPIEEAQKALENYNNATKWEKDLTERAQAISEREKFLTSLEEKHTQPKQQETEDPYAELPEEQREALQALEEKYGFVRKEKVEALEAKIESLENASIIADIQADATNVQKSYGLSLEEKNNLMNFAAQNGMLQWPMEDVYLFMNRDKLKESEREAIRVKQGEARRGRAAKTEPTSAPKTAPTPFKYDSEKHKGMSMNQLLAMAMAQNEQ